MGGDEGTMDAERLLAERFKCAKCGSYGARVRKLAMTGTGLSRLFNLQYNHFAFVSCEQCGFTEVYDLKILSGKMGRGMNILDVLFGG